MYKRQEQQQKDYGIYFEDNTDGSHTLTLYNANIETSLSSGKMIMLPDNTNIVLMGTNNVKNTNTAKNSVRGIDMKSGIISSDKGTSGVLNISGCGYGIYFTATTESELGFKNANVNIVSLEENSSLNAAINIKSTNKVPIFENSEIVITNLFSYGISAVSYTHLKTEENNEEIIDSSSEAELADVTVPEVALNWQEAGVRESDNKQIYKIVCNLSAPANLQMVETVLNYDDSKIQPVYAIGDLSNDQYSDLLYTEPDQDNRITVSGALEVAAKAGTAVANELYHADIEGRKAVRMTAGWTTPVSKAVNSLDLMSFYFRLKDGVTLEDFDKETITLHPVQTYTEEQLSTGEDFGVEVRIFEKSPAIAYKYSDVRESGYFESLGDSNIHLSLIHI